MKCYIGIDSDPIDCKVTENLGFQGGYHAKFVEYDGEEFVVIKKDGKWIRHIPSIHPRIPIVGQDIGGLGGTVSIMEIVAKKKTGGRKMNIQEIIKSIRNGERIEAERAELQAMGLWWIDTDLDTHDDVEDPYVIWGVERHMLYCDNVVVAEWVIEGCASYEANVTPVLEWGLDATSYRNNANDSVASLLATLGIDDPMLEIPEPD